MHLAKCGTCGGAFVWMTRGPHVSVPIEKKLAFPTASRGFEPGPCGCVVKGLTSSADAVCSAEPICLSLRHLSRHKHTKKNHAPRLCSMCGISGPVKLQLGPMLIYVVIS